jgi:hypothetical protein
MEGGADNDETAHDAKAGKRRLTDKLAQQMRQLNLNCDSTRSALSATSINTAPSGSSTLPDTAADKKLNGSRRSNTTKENQAAFNSSFSCSNYAPSDVSRGVSPPQRGNFKKRSRDDSLNSVSDDTLEEEVLRPMKRLRIGDAKFSEELRSDGDELERTTSRSQSNPFITISEPREDSEETEKAIVTRSYLHPEALHALMKFSSLWKLRPPPATPDNSLALVPYTRSPGSVLHSLLLRYLERARREDMPDERPESSVIVESLSSDDEDNDAETDTVSLEDIEMIDA